MIDCNEWKTEKLHECTNMGKSKTTRIMMATVCDVTNGWGLRENFKPHDFFLLLDRVYVKIREIQQYRLSGQIRYQKD